MQKRKLCLFFWIERRQVRGMGQQPQRLLPEKLVAVGGKLRISHAILRLRRMDLADWNQLIILRQAFRTDVVGSNLDIVISRLLMANVG